jgi:beta-RFAP synthase
VSGEAEAAAFARLRPPPEREAERVAHIVLMQLLPALAEGDLAIFGSALTAVQHVTGRWFAPVQGGAFAPGASAELVRAMAEWGAAGVGQSSWGPAVYGIVEGADEAAALAAYARSALDRGDGGSVFAGSFASAGATVEVRAP